MTGLCCAEFVAAGYDVCMMYDVLPAGQVLAESDCRRDHPIRRLCRIK